MRRNRIVNVLLVAIIILLIIGPVATVGSHADRGVMVYGVWNLHKDTWALDPERPGRIYTTTDVGEALDMCDWLDEGLDVYAVGIMWGGGRPPMLVQRAERSR